MPVPRWLRHAVAVPLLVLAVASGAPEARALTAPGAAGDPSPGCGQPPPATTPASVQVDGRTRSFITALPADYRPERPHPLVFAFHGRTSPNHVVRNYYHLEDNGPADAIYVYPSGLRDASGGFTWWERGDPPDALRDFALFDRLVELFERRYCIDRARIYAVGHSLGASFVNSLGCARGDVLRAIGTLAGGIERSRCRGRVAAAIFHNPADRLVDFDYGLAVRNFYAARTSDPDGPDFDRLERFNCARYGAAAAPNPILWCPHNRDLRHGRYYPHQWPAETGAAIMRFFASLPDGRPDPARLLQVMITEHAWPPRPALRPRLVSPSPLKPHAVAHLPVPKPRDDARVAWRD